MNSNATSAARAAPAPLLRASVGDHALLDVFDAWAEHRDSCGRCSAQDWKDPHLGACCAVGRALFAAWARRCTEGKGSGTLYDTPPRPYYVKKRSKRKRRKP